MNMRLSQESLAKHVQSACSAIEGLTPPKELTSGVKGLVEAVLCVRPPSTIQGLVDEQDLYHSIKCIDGKCDLCGVGKIGELIPNALLDGVSTIDVQHFEYANVTRRDGSTAKKLDLVKKKVDLGVFVNDIKKELSDFIKHDYTYKWQSVQYKDCLETFEKGSIVIAMDFAENHAFLYQEEIQSLHWTPHQCTVFVVVLYRHAEDGVDGVGSESTEQARHIVKEHHFFISDDGIKDVAWVKHALDELVKDLRGRSVTVRGVRFWSDGCAAQFKSGSGFWDRAKQAKSWGCRVEHHFFCSGHGKGEHDGAGANVKHAASLHNIHNMGAPLQTALDLFT